MEVEKLQDFTGTLEELNIIIQELINLYGKDTLIQTDAGYNNVSFLILNKLNDEK